MDDSGWTRAIATITNDLHVIGILFHTRRATPQLNCGQCSRSNPSEGIENHLAVEGKQFD